MKLEEIELVLKEDPGLAEAITCLIDVIILNKKFQIEESLLICDASKLKTENIIIDDNGKLKINDNEVFYYLFFNYFKSKLSFQDFNDLDLVFKFIDDVDNHFNVERTIIIGRTEFFKQFTAFTLRYCYEQYKVVLVEYALKLKRNPPHKNLFKFNSAFCSLLPHLDLNVKEIYSVLSHLLSEVSTNAIGINGDAIEISKALRRYAEFDTKKGRKLLSVSIKQKEYVSNLTIGLIAGIYEVDREKFRNELLDLRGDKKLHSTIIIALGGVKANSISELKYNFEFIEEISPKDDEINFYLPRFYNSLLENVLNINNQLKNKCFSKLRSLITHTNPNIRGSVLHEIRFLENYDKEINKLLIELLGSKDYDPKFDNAIAEVFYKRGNVSGFFIFLIQYAEKFKLKFEPKRFESAIHHFENMEPEFSNEMIKLLIHDKGEVRFVGNRILTHLSRFHHIFKFKIDILTLSDIDQCKLWVSVMEDYREPKYSVPLLLQLINSPNHIVQEAFICKLEELTENYFSAVIKVMKSELDLNEPHNQSVILRIQNYLNVYSSNIDKKNGIKEIDPYYTQSRAINSFQRKFNLRMSEQTDKVVNENSVFAQFATTIVLAKGGGWKHEKHTDISQLSTIRHSFSLPRESFIQGEYFDWEFRNKYLANWKNDFKEWEAMIS